MAKRNSLTLKDKVAIIRQLGTQGKQSEIVAERGLSKSVVSRIWRDKENILEAYSNLPRSTKKIRKSNFREIESHLLLWFADIRMRNLPISCEMLLEQANIIGKNLGLSDFNCSSSWVNRFRKRHSIVVGTVSGEALSVNVNTVQDWLGNQWPKIREGYSNKDIFNADETGLFYKCLPNKTLKYKGETCSGGKLSKERLSVLLCTSMEGEKRKPMIIGKSKKPRCFKNANTSEFNYESNTKAWMISSLFKSEVISWDIELQGRKIILLIDNCSAHPDINELLVNIKLVFLPANTTSVLQPLDQGIIKNFKFHYRKMLLSKMLQCYDSGIDFSVSILDAMRLIHTAWNSVSCHTITNCFRHTGIIHLEDDNESPSKDFINLELVSEFFDDQDDISTYLEIDAHVQAIESFSDVNHDEDLEEFEIPNESSLTEAILSIKKISDYYNHQTFSDDIRTSILTIERDLNDKYLVSRKRKN